MGKKNTKGTQKVNPVTDASGVSPPYETAFGMSNTEEVKRGKQNKHVDLHSCKCKSNKPTRTWASITNLYGDADTTEVWDNREQKPKNMFSSKLHKQEKPKATSDKSENDDVIIYPTSDLKKKPAKLSHIGLHRRLQNYRNKIKIRQKINENSIDTELKSSPYIEPKVKFMLSKNAETGLTDYYDTKAICTQGPCREALENLYNLHGLKYTPDKDTVIKSGKKDKSKKGKQKTKTSTKENKIIKKSKNKQAKEIKTKKDGNIGDGDQIPPIPLKKENLKDVQCRCSFIGKMMGHTNCKCKDNTGVTLQTSSNVNDDNSKIEKTKTYPTKEYKIIKMSKKQAKANKTTNDGNVGFGDQISPIPLKYQDLKDVQCKCSFIEKMMRHKIGKSKNDTRSTFQTSSNIIPARDPLLEMKVNLKDMRVINSFEVNENIRKLGRTEKRMSCKCPSHIKRLKGEVCERGPCERALENQNTHFDCKCQKRNIIECNDSTCDSKTVDMKIKYRQKKVPKSSVYKEGNKPLFDVMLDPTEMSVINANEIKNIIGKASQNRVICPTGICNKMSKEKNVLVNCRCVGKKLTPYINECEESTCRNPKKKSKFSCLCSRVFSISETWTGEEENRRWPVRGNRYDKSIKRDDLIVKSHYKRNGVKINLPRGQTPKKGTYTEGKLSDVYYKSFCECKKQFKNPSLKKKVNKKVSRRRRRRGFFRKKKKDLRTCKEKMLDCLDREQEECEKKVKKKSKDYKKNEKKAIKENKKIVAEQKATFKANQHQWNCLTNFISGLLNVGFESVKKAFQIVFSVIVDPISCYVYVKEKIKNPPAAIIRVIEWFIRTWKNKSSVIAKAIDNSNALNVIADEIESSSVYNALAPTPKTPAERMLRESRNRTRKRRMHKRQNEALYGCRHIMLTTMRKTPCLWFYHIWPEMYPQCLSLLAFMNNFLHVLLYCGAIMCWTPCIVVCEMCRACMCCLLCTH